MGFWGPRPYQNDDAADWFRDLWEDFPVPEKIDQTLDLDVGTNHAHIRAAIHVLLQFGDTYQWPIDFLDRQLKTAIERLEEMLNAKIYPDVDTRREIRREIRILKSRL
jgi:hypothetical protein